MSHVRVRGNLLGLGLWLCAASVVCAQAPDADQVFAPLIDQAEIDQRAGRLVEARARARATLGRVSSSSPLATRANAVLQVAEAATGAAEPSLDVVFEPLVLAAEADGAAGRNALALARLSAAMALVPAEGPLATRARNVYAMVSRNAQGTTPAPAPPAPAPPAPAQPAAPPQVIVVTQPAAPAPAPMPPPHAMVAPKVHAQAQPAVTDPDRRTGAEMAELRLAGGALGLLLGVQTLAVVGAEDPLLFLAIPLFTTAAGLVAVGALDSGDGMRRGVPAAISTGVLTGFGDGLLLWGVMRNDIDDGAGALSIMAGTTVAGTIVGGVFGYVLRPTIAESRFVLSMPLCALWIGLMSALAFESSADKTWMTSFVAYNMGLGLAMMISAVTDVSMERVAFTSGSVAVGTLLGLMVVGVIAGKMHQDGNDVGSHVVPAGIAIGSIGGLMAGLLIHEREINENTSSGVARALVELDLNLGVTPVPGGAALGFGGRL